MTSTERERPPRAGRCQARTVPAVGMCTAALIETERGASGDHMVASVMINAARIAAAQGRSRPEQACHRQPGRTASQKPSAVGTEVRQATLAGAHQRQQRPTDR